MAVAGSMAMETNLKGNVIIDRRMVIGHYFALDSLDEIG
jgi:hypothetical protein